ncbi:hypothetical protein B4134_2264 [Bacillus safensis]|nr:hypothetical protein B4107_2136 [Bacillus safensis]KIL15276.1 hypothetical protein B4129_2180 [Bacillus safensis]KIL21503.1 hypothetical protein B4134_2264 [Bacillus safensis]
MREITKHDSFIERKKRKQPAHCFLFFIYRAAFCTFTSPAP